MFQAAVHPTGTFPIPFTNKVIALKGTLGWQVLAVGADIKFTTEGFKLKVSAILGFDLGVDWKLQDKK